MEQGRKALRLEPQESAKAIEELLFSDRSPRLANVSGVDIVAKVGESKRVALLKLLQSEAQNLFSEVEVDSIADNAERELMRNVVLKSNWAGVPEFSDRWLYFLKRKIWVNVLVGDLILQALDLQDTTSFSTGFDAFETQLIRGCCKILRAYHAYYAAYVFAIQDPEIVAKLEKNPPIHSPQCMDHYTVITLSESGEFVPVPFATFFKGVLGPVTAAFDECIQGLEGTRGCPNPHIEAYITFMIAYRDALNATDMAQLENIWTEVDRKWMDTRGPIQVLHDIETGYGDPLRTKATPDFSLRFLDDTHEEANKTIKFIQEILVKYFSARSTKLAKQGLDALSNTLAGIYFLPSKTGAALQFSFSGQSIPNREEVKMEKGVKIYFDAFETELRILQTKSLVHKVFLDAQTSVLDKYKPNAIEQTVWHVAAHEVGHAIYNLYSLINQLTACPQVAPMLEEPRAELCALHTMRLLQQHPEVFPQELAQKALAHMALDALRYFSKFESQALKPYITFQIFAYKVYESTGYLKRVQDPAVDSWKLVLDESKTNEVLEVFSRKFEQVLALMDEVNTEGLRVVLEDELAPLTPFVQDVVDRVCK